MIKINCEICGKEIINPKMDKIQKIKKIISERIEHPMYPNMDFNKLNKKKITMEIEDILEERRKILSEILFQVEEIEKLRK